MSALAVQNLVEISSIQPLIADGDAAVAVRFTAVGDEASLRAFVWAMETGKPLTRLGPWSWRAGDGIAGLQLEATAGSVWRRP